MKKAHELAAFCVALFLSIFSLSVMAYAQETPTAASSPTTASSSKTPDGTASVVESATGEDGKRFYTISTPVGNVFYLVIDFGRSSDNVYFLDSVKEKDLLALAEQTGDLKKGNDVDSTTTSSQNSSNSISTEESETTPKAKSNMTTIVLILSVVLLGGGIGYYLKIYRKKHNSNHGYEYEETEEYQADEMAPPFEEPENDTAPWESGEDEE